ncbi:MAG TPA: LysE family translocator [Pseudonocardiaceae bacterium]|jgi:threonine/homoserine/homoserine lactone efflux protein|nr:LysE family translocator [Pseudonocardiaceae bacterium]
MPVSSVLAFWGVAALLIVMPGPDWAFAISAGVRRQVVPAAGGIVLGYLGMTIAVAAGVGAVVTSAPTALTILTVIGGLYLAWLGFATLRHPAATPSDAPEGCGGRRLGTVFQGMAVSGLNPKGLLMFVAILPQFTDPAAHWPLPVQLATLGLAFTVTCAAVYLCVGTFARRLLHARPAVSRVVSRVSGASMVVLGAALLVERL